MNTYIANSNPNLTVIRRSKDGTITLTPIAYWVDLRDQRFPVDLTRMVIDFWVLIEANFAVHDASSGHVYMRDGTIYETLEAFDEASQ
jgi:hypothetical protein